MRVKLRRDNPNFIVLFHNDRHSTIDESFDDVEEGIDKALEAYREVLTDPNLKSAEIVILANHQTIHFIRRLGD